MVDINILRNLYFVNRSDIDSNCPGERVPQESQGNISIGGNRVEYFIDGDNYFGALRREIQELMTVQPSEKPFFYFANWRAALVEGKTLGVVTGVGDSAWDGKKDFTKPPEDFVSFRLYDGSTSTPPPMIDELEAMAVNGVDVRAILWISPVLLNVTSQVLSRKEAKGLEFIYTSNVHTMLSAKALREKSSMNERKVMLSTIQHTLGSMHLKMVILGKNDNSVPSSARIRAYVSGLDLVINRLSGQNHELFDCNKPQYPHGQFWHDVGVKIEGPATGPIYDYYAQIWNEQLQRRANLFRMSDVILKSHIPKGEGGEEIPSRAASATVDTSPAGRQPTQHVQILRTAPRMKFGWAGGRLGIKKLLVAGLRQDKIGFAPNGIFEFRPAIRKAISNASRYIYIEDQNFTSFEIMGWIHDRLNREPNLKAIFLYGLDPDDPPSPAVVQGIQKHLIEGENNDRRLLANSGSRVAFYLRGKGRPPSRDTCTDETTQLRRRRNNGIICHAKVTIIDDKWVAVGTANAKRSSLYTDIELSIGVLDDTDNLSFAQRLRKDLWGEHCGLIPAGTATDPLLDLDTALGIWKPSWISQTIDVRLKPELEDMTIPPYFAREPEPHSGLWKSSNAPSPPTFDSKQYDLDDADSRLEY